LEWPSTSQSTNHKKTVGKLDFLQVCLQSETATGAVFLFINDFRRSLMTYRQSRGIAAVDG
jgi:hypothetical protein